MKALTDDITCAYDVCMETNTTTKIANGYIYRGVHIKRDDYYTNGREWTYTYVLNTAEPIYELAVTLRDAKTDIDALIQQGFIAKEDWLYHPSCEEVQS